MIKYLSVLALATSLAAQTAAPKDPPKPKEELTSLEKAGLGTILKEYQQVLQDLSQANIDIAKSHPGYHLDSKAPLSGVLVKDEPKVEPKAEVKAPASTEKK